MNSFAQIGEDSGLALSIPENQTFDDWVDLGQKLCATDRRLQWWIGDWWATGTHRYGERAKAAADGIFGLGFGAIANAASVCRSFETSRRREALSYSHHVEVASLPPGDADILLDRAQGEGWKVSQIRAEAIKRKTQLGIYTPRQSDDPEHSELLTVARAWNRASRDTRETFLEMANQAEFGLIDP